MNRTDAERIYDGLIPADQRLLGLVGVFFAYEFALTIFSRLSRELFSKEAPADEG